MFSPVQKNLRRYRLAALIGIFALLSNKNSIAQHYVNGSFYHLSPFQTLILPDYQSIQADRLSNQKWFLSRYTAVSAGYASYPGANAYYLSAPIGMQLNRSLGHNLYAFGGVYVAPTFTSFNQPFVNAPYYKAYPSTMYPHNYFSVNPGIQMGLMYVNESGTFSVSGSIRAETRTYPVYPYPVAPNKNPKR